MFLLLLTHPVELSIIIFLGILISVADLLRVTGPDCAEGCASVSQSTILSSNVSVGLGVLGTS